MVGGVWALFAGDVGGRKEKRIGKFVFEIDHADNN